MQLTAQVIALAIERSRFLSASLTFKQLQTQICVSLTKIKLSPTVATMDLKLECKTALTEANKGSARA